MYAGPVQVYQTFMLVLVGTSLQDDMTTGVIPISLFLLATGTVLRKAAIDRGVRLATGRYGCRQINKPSNSTVSVFSSFAIILTRKRDMVALV